MFRIIGTIHDDDKLCGYMLYDEVLHKPKAVEYWVFLISYRNSDKISNLRYMNEEIYCTDCAISKLPHYDKAGNYLSNAAIFTIVAFGKPGMYQLLDCRDFSTSLVTEQVIIDMLRQHPNAITNAYLRAGVLAIKERRIIPVNTKVAVH